MGRRAKFNTAAAIMRRIKEGRGQGDGRNYQPWYRVKDVSSLGRRHRIYSVKFDRVMHLLSDLERTGLYSSECCDEVIENKEQFPHNPRARTQAIAKELGFKHPRAPGAHCDHVLTTDQVWFCKTTLGTVIQPIFVKYHEDLQDPRVLEKRKIEEVSWSRWESSIPILPLKDFDEFVVNQTFVNNWDLIRDTLRPDYFEHFPEKLADQVDDCVSGIAEEGIATLDEVSEFAAAKLRLPQAQVLTGIHYLIASTRWGVDLEAAPLAPFLPLKFCTGNKP